MCCVRGGILGTVWEGSPMPSTSTPGGNLTASLILDSSLVWARERNVDPQRVEDYSYLFNLIRSWDLVSNFNFDFRIAWALLRIQRHLPWLPAFDIGILECILGILAPPLPLILSARKFSMAPPTEYQISFSSLWPFLEPSFIKHYTVIKNAALIRFSWLVIC